LGMVVYSLKNFVCKRKNFDFKKNFVYNLNYARTENNNFRVPTAKKITDYFKSQRIKTSVDTVLNYMYRNCSID